MSLLNKIDKWLNDAIGDADFVLDIGDWRSMDYSASTRYISYRLNGGRSPMSDGTRGTMVMVNIVGAKESVPNFSQVGQLSEPDVIYNKANDMMLKASNERLTDCLIQVNAIGDIIGPAHTSGDRSVVALTLEFIH